MELKYTITQIVKNTAIFEKFKEGKLYYSIVVDGKVEYIFPIDITNAEDIGEATFQRMEKGIYLMRYINKAIKDESLVERELNETANMNESELGQFRGDHGIIS